MDSLLRSQDGTRGAASRIQLERRVGALPGAWRQWAACVQNPKNGCLRSPEAYIFVRGVITISYHSGEYATRLGNKPSAFWTYLKENGCRGCQKTEEMETIQHVLGGECKALGKNKNGRYREEMRRLLEKCRKLMYDTQSKKGEKQVEKAIQAIQQSRGHKDIMVKEVEELALRQTISGIIPEWQQVDDKREKGAIVVMKLWTGELMNRARTHMKIWMEKKNEHKASVQRRWDNRGNTLEMFTRWKRNAGYKQDGLDEEQGKEIEEGKKKKTYGIKYWGRVRTIPRILRKAKNFLQKGIG
eukprot:6207228-Pleurochrysis_carterae.AAC.1